MKYRALTILLFDLLLLFANYVVAAHAVTFISNEIIQQHFIEPFSRDNDVMLYTYGFSCIIGIILFYSAGHYTRRITWWGQAQSLLFIFFVLFLVNGFMSFAIQERFSRLWISYAFVEAFVFVLLGRYFSMRVGRKLGIWSVPTTVIGNGDNAIETLFAVYSDPYSGYDPATIIFYQPYKAFDAMDLPVPLRKVKSLSGPSTCKSYIRNSRKDMFYILAPEAFREIDGEKIIALFDDLGINNYACVPPTKGLRLYGMEPEYFFGHNIMLMNLGHRIRKPLMPLFKRLMDATLSSILLVLLSPFFLIASMLVMMDGGSVFFTQKRVGKDGKIFPCIKFRTMRVNAEAMLKDILRKDKQLKAEWERGFKLKNDPRVTRIGKFLRLTSLDELPQLINVLKGDMSLVGPRPITRQERKYFGDKFSIYTSVRPGITGLAQVNGRKDSTFKYRIYLDSWYVEHWSLWYDIVILFKTARIVLTLEGAY
ncbi:MAG: exopolysaccharide biosynthesis polyprenyl glycosylphosphotransferase [Proteobacteria bacterium]|nr:exopolysaccharide biosynthesis polyprenyl glycosylphosphotransferase [Pseudomonadota bacterium]